MFFAAVDIGGSVQQGLDAFFAFIPKLIGFLIVLLIGYIVARVVKGVVTKLLEKVGLDRALHSGSTGQYVNKVAPDVRAVEPDRLARLLVPLPRRGRDRRLAARHRRAGQLRRRDRRLHPERHRRGPDLRDRRRRRRRRRRPRRPHDGRHADRQGRRLRRARAGDGDRDVHDPQPAPDRAGDRDDHLRRADRRRVPRDGARLRPRRPRGRRAGCSPTPTTRARSSAARSARHGGRQGARPAGRRSAPRTRRSSARATADRDPADRPTAAPTARRARGGSADGPHQGARGDPRHDAARTAPGAVRGTSIARQREEYGGINWGAAFFGWLVAIGVAALLTAILSAAGAAIGLTEASASTRRATPTPSASSAASSCSRSWRSPTTRAATSPGGCRASTVRARARRLADRPDRHRRAGRRGGAAGRGVQRALAAQPPAHPGRRGQPDHRRPDRPRGDRRRDAAGRHRRRQGRAPTTTARSTESETTHHEAPCRPDTHVQLARPGSLRLRRRQDRQDRGDLPRRGDRRARVGAGQHRHVRRQVRVRAAAGRHARTATACGPVRQGPGQGRAEGRPRRRALPAGGGRALPPLRPRLQRGALGRGLPEGGAGAGAARDPARRRGRRAPSAATRPARRPTTR